MALKKLAGNTGYHFQLLTAVIEVNELQKRRVVGKLEKHLGSLAGNRVALLGLAFKPDTDDMREASSLVLAARLQGEGAEVAPTTRLRRAARELLPEVEFASPPRRRSRARTRRPRHRVAGVRRARLGGARGRMANPLIVDGRNFLDPAAARRGLHLRGHRARVHRRSSDGWRADARPPARRRGGDPASTLAQGQRPQPRPLPADEHERAHQLATRPNTAAEPRPDPLVGEARGAQRRGSRKLRPSTSSGFDIRALELLPVELGELRPLGDQDRRVGALERLGRRAAISTSGSSSRAASAAIGS